MTIQQEIGKLIDEYEAAQDAGDFDSAELIWKDIEILRQTRDRQLVEERGRCGGV